MESASKKLTRFTLMNQIMSTGSSQRQIASEIGVSAATVNQMIRKAVLEGVVEKVGDSTRRTIYQLTASGREQMRRLARDLLFSDTELFATLRGWLEGKVLKLTRKGVRRVAIYGTGHMLELSLVSLQKELQVVGLAPAAGYGLPLFDLASDLARQAGSIDAVVSVTNEVPGEVRRLLREHKTPLIFFT